MSKRKVIINIIFLLLELILFVVNALIKNEAIYDYLKIFFLSCGFYIVLNIILYVKNTISKNIYIQISFIICSSLMIIFLTVLCFKDLFYLVPIMLILPILFTGIGWEYGVLKGDKPNDKDSSLL